ncbi:hypothetical protein E4L96_12475 [Massilia arenosa]|uniref:Nitrate reductase n=2 Tax=Zemynaea arenosa TaxID=2561931 RepID=A0A4Y9SEH5_9BURK|nr:hypothetical protein E4L96_12475 [Massilia arenosa]
MSGQRTTGDAGAESGGAAGGRERSSAVLCGGCRDNRLDSERLFGDGRFQHADGRARFVATRPRMPQHATDAEYPLALNTGRVRDQWHTMTRTGRAAKLAGHTPECFVDLHPQDALLAGVREGELARVRSAWGALVARVRHSGGIARGGVFVPIHWNGQTASDARVGALVNPVVDPISGEPEFKHTPVTVEPFPVDWHAFILTRRGADLDALTYWTRVQETECVRYEAAGRGRIRDRADWARQLVDEHDPRADWLEYEDASEGIYRAVLLSGDQLQAVVFISSRPDLPPRTWLAAQFGKTIDARTRAALLAGQPLGQRDDGPVVCSCFGVGAGTIKQAIIKRRLCSVQEVTACLKAGGNCGSCIPEIRKLLDSTGQRSTA